MNPRERLKMLRRASWIGIVGNLMLSAMKVAGGFIAGSLAVVGDGLDSLSDVVTSLVTLRTAQTASRPPDTEHPWGHGRAETIATKTLSLIVMMAGFQLLVMTASKITGGGSADVPGRVALVVSGISILGKGVLSLVKYRAGVKTESRMMKADALNMRNDILLSLLVFLGVFTTRVLQAPIIDILAGLGVSIWIIVSGFRIFLSAKTELMDGIDDPDLYRQVFSAVESVDGASNPHRVRIRRLNAYYVIDLDVEVDGTLTVSAAHRLACRVEAEIRGRIPKVFDIMVHVEPSGVAEHVEGFGLIPGDVDGATISDKDT